MRGFYSIFATGVACLQGTLISALTAGHVQSGICIIYVIDQSFSRTCDFSGISTSNTPLYFLDFASVYIVYAVLRPFQFARVYILKQLNLFNLENLNNE